jgi:hypothetical protein
MENSGYDLTNVGAGSFKGQQQPKEAEMDGAIQIRLSNEGDRERIARLAELDSRRVPAGEAMLAFVDDELRAAVELDTGQAVADPFHPTVDLVEMLRMSAGQPNGSSGFGLRVFRHVAEAA